MATHIVVIDNDEAIRASLTIGLSNEGWEVFSYDYAHFSLSSVQQLRPDLIILDFNKQGGGLGWEFLQLLKMEDATANIPILITATPTLLSAEIRDYLSTRYIHVIDKPFDRDTFLPLVQKTLALARQSGFIVFAERSLPILVVEDKEELRDAITTILGMEGYQVAAAENGLQALDAVYRADHCLILLDLEMPIMNGFEFLSAYDKQPRPHTPVIILSGANHLQARVFPTFVIEVIAKPFEVSQLLEVVRKYAQPV